MFMVEVGHGCNAVPYDTVCVRGIYHPSLNVARSNCPPPYVLLIPYKGAFRIDNRVVQYDSLEACREEAECLHKLERMDAVPL